MMQSQSARIDEFKAHFRGDVLLPGDASYDKVRQICNAMIDRRPAVDHGVPDLSHLVVARVPGKEHVPPEVRFELVDPRALRLHHACLRCLHLTDWRSWLSASGESDWEPAP